MSRRDYFREENKLKNVSIVFGVTLAITVIAFIYIFSLYNKKLEENARQSILDLGRINSVVPNTDTSGISLVSQTEDKGINEVQKETAVNETKLENVIALETAKEPVEEKPKTEEPAEEQAPEETLEEVVEPITFTAPVNGEIIKDFATETLLYSETLEEWTVHNGIDIKAPKTTVVVASSDGVVESIKNDPRYGLTITITHRDGFKTVYANLLTAEFVSQGQTIEKGRTIGTVGETASFEISEDPHLHFEMIKDGEYVNPTLYLK